jgi:pimeloyl-ACP methyl ester carboxylesterase
MEEHSDHLGELPVFWRRADGPLAGVLYLHGSPTSCDDWLPFLEAGGGVAPDLPGFGRSGKPGHFPYELEGYADFLDAFAELAGLGEVDLVMHDWGAVGLAWAARRPERVRRLVLINPAPLPPEVRWARLDRAFAHPVLGEIAIGCAIKPVFTRALERLAGAPLPPGFVEHAWRCFDPGTQRAILRLHRSMDRPAREDLAGRLHDIRVPALLACRSTDPYSSSAVADAYRGRLPGAAPEVLPGVGHWPWLHAGTEFVDRVSRYLTRGISHFR